MLPSSHSEPKGERPKGRFWLDGGYDRDQVEACPKHPVHDWWIFRLGDVCAEGSVHDPDEMMVVCRSCWVPRCGHTTDADPCILPRHHQEMHITQAGALEDAQTWPGSEKPLPPLEVIQSTDNAPPGFRTYCPHCFSGDPGEDYCSSCGEAIE